jgi:hypothetical protein
MYQEIYPGSKLKHFKVIHQVGAAADLCYAWQQGGVRGVE